MTFGPRTSSRPGWPTGSGSQRLGIHDAHADAGQRVADLAALGADLAEAGGAEVVRVDRHRRASIRCSRSLRAGGCRTAPRRRCASRSGSFSAAVITTRRLPKSSGAQPRM